MVEHLRLVQAPRSGSSSESSTHASIPVDFDEQTADDWDVDMSVYYDKGTGGGGSCGRNWCYMYVIYMYVTVC